MTSRERLISTLYHRHARSLSQYLRARFGSSAVDLDDVVQSAFLKLADHDDPASITDHRAYLFATACNIAIDSQRRRYRRKMLHRDLDIYLMTQRRADASSEKILIDRGRLKSLEQAMQGMPELRRSIFTSVRLNGTKVKDVCATTGLSEAAIHKHVARAVADCSRAIEKYDTAKGGYSTRMR